jgi:hypothetical protein
MDLDRKLKVALDESRLLILGAQVLFGFQFQAIFQEEFKTISPGSQGIHCAGLVLMLLAVCSLIAPSVYHQIIFQGETRRRAMTVATGFATVSLLPLTLGLGASSFVIFGRLFGRNAGLAFGGGFTVVALSLLYGLGFALKKTNSNKPSKEPLETPLKTKIEQMLTEARVIIPGGQALLGFQFVVTLNQSFQELPMALQYVHAAALCAVALAVVLLMTPAALHRIAFHGEDDAAFFRIGSALVVSAVAPLAIGISGDIALVFYKVTGSRDWSATAGIGTACVLLGVWLAYPLWRRTTSSTPPQ